MKGAAFLWKVYKTDTFHMPTKEITRSESPYKGLQSPPPPPPPSLPRESITVKESPDIGESFTGA